MSVVAKRSLGGTIRTKVQVSGHVSLGTVIRDDTQTFILVDEYGNEVPAVLVDEEVALTATTNDIRIGTTAVTDAGVVIGEKEIPAYHTTEGMRVVSAGEDFVIDNLGRHCEFTKLQALVCSNSVSTEKVCIDTKVYEANSTAVLSEVSVDTESQVVHLGITNDTVKPYVIRYLTYKEEH